MRIAETNNESRVTILRSGESPSDGIPWRNGRGNGTAKAAETGSADGRATTNGAAKAAKKESSNGHAGTNGTAKTTGSKLPPMPTVSPNPCKSETMISYALKRDAFVELKLYDILGRTVRTLVETDLRAGDYEFEWDVRNDSRQRVSEGLYTWVMRVDGQPLSGLVTVE